MGVGTQCRKSMSPFPVGLLPPQNWVWCVWCGVFGVVCVCNWWWPTILQNVLVFPMVAGFDRKNRMPLLLETKQDEHGKNTLFVESVCCMVPIACNLIDSAYGLNNLVNMQILTFHHTV